MDVQIWNLDPAKLAYVEHVGPYAEVEKAWEKLCGWAAPAGLFDGKTRFYGMYYDDPSKVAPEKLRSEAIITVEKEMDAPAEVQFKDFPGGKYAVAVHLGPYDKLVDSWTDFYENWLPKSGYEYEDSPCLEQYMNDPTNTRPEHLVTLLLMPLK